MHLQKTISFYTLGCKLNYSETSSFSRMAEEYGMQIIPFQNGADIYVINTCSVTDHADKKCRHIVRQAMRQNADALIVVVGCYAQLKPKEISEIPGVDLVLGAAEKFQLMEHISQLSKNNSGDKKGKYFTSLISDVSIFNSAYSFGERTRTFLKVQDGCDYNCSFCTIPLARGKSRSDTIEHVIKTAKEIAEKGIKEIVLTGVNLGDFGNTDSEETFLQLITHLDRVEGIERFRISSIEPNLLHDEIIDFVAGSQKFVPHFHIPLQSGSNKILKSMRRRYLKELYQKRIEKIKQIMPHACIGVDVITGFPGESHADFLETYYFLNELEVSYLHVFTYSERANTHAISLGEIVQIKTREERTAQLINLSVKKKRAFYESQLSQTRNVLWETDHHEGKLFGFTDNYIRVSINYDPALVHTIQPYFLKQISSDAETIEAVSASEYLFTIS